MQQQAQLLGIHFADLTLLKCYGHCLSKRHRYMPGRNKLIFGYDMNYLVFNKRLKFGRRLTCTKNIRTVFVEVISW